MDEFVHAFILEAKELLLQLEDDLIILEKNPTNPETINNIFRVMHTLKGSAGMVGFKRIQNLTHEFESVYSKIRDGWMKVDTNIIDKTLKAKDVILTMLIGKGETDDSNLIELIRSACDDSGLSPDHTIADHVSHYVILYSPDFKIFERGIDPDKTLMELSGTGHMFSIKHENNSTWELQRNEKRCDTSWEIYLRTYNDLSEIQEVFLFYETDEYKVYPLSDGFEPDSDLKAKLTDYYGNNFDFVKHIKECFSGLPKIAIESPQEDTVPAPARPVEYSKIDSEGMVSVSSGKLDELMNLVSELVTQTATIQAGIAQFSDQKLHNSVENIEKLTKKFRNNALDLRLIPVGTLLNKFRRQVRDLSKELGKKVELLIEGQDIEIDKSILKSIESPLQHTIRNSIDHGIEFESERIKAGKNPEGLLKITAFYSGACVIIQVQDDGRGINLERVRECAIKKGFILPDQEVKKEDLIKLIMEPGFTTNENVSIVSGRGVGMDVVRKELNSVGGSLEVFTEKDLGTSITMKLPTTLTIIDTLMVNVDQTQLLIPVMDIEYCFKERTDALFQKDNRYIQYKNTPIPLVSLRRQFKYPPVKEADQMVIVINKFERRYAITADEIIGEHQAVIKPLGDLFINQPYFSGGSILVDGKLAFILDTNFLFNQITKI